MYWTGSSNILDMIAANLWTHGGKQVIARVLCSLYNTGSYQHNDRKVGTSHIHNARKLG